MSDVHPTLEAVARAIREKHRADGHVVCDASPGFLPEARAALLALADGLEKRGYPGSADLLREIAAEPVTVENVLRDFGAPEHLAKKYADVLRAAGLVAE